MLRKFKIGLLGAAVLAVVLVGYKAWRVLGQPIEPAPALSGLAVDQRPVDLAKSLQAAHGKPVMVIFWATWCPECLAEQANVQAISRDYTVIGVAWKSENDTAVASHMRKFGLTYPTLNDVDGTLAKQWGVRGVPAHFIVRSDGKTRFSVEGGHPEWALRARLWWAKTFAG